MTRLRLSYSGESTPPPGTLYGLGLKDGGGGSPAPGSRRPPPVPESPLPPPVVRSGLTSSTLRRQLFTLRSHSSLHPLYCLSVRSPANSFLSQSCSHQSALCSHRRSI